MALTLGPMLGFRGASDTTWQISALWVRGAEPPQPTFDGAAAEIVATTNLYTAPSGEVVWRVDVDVARPAAGEVAIVYTLAGESHTFHVPAKGHSLRVAVVSCNGFSDGKDKREYGPNANERWESLLEKHAAAHRHLLLGVGDQVYADSVWVDQDLEWLQEWLDANQRKRARFTLPAGHAGELAQFYFELYCDRWSQDAVKDALASIPALMMWDDHDIFDGWGSREPELQNSEVFKAIFVAAEAAFRVFQLQVPAGAPPLGGIPGASLSWTRRVDRLGIVALDLRSRRTPSQVMDESSWPPLLEAIRALASDPAAPIDHLFVISGPPVMYPSTGVIEDIVDAIPGDQGFEDDLRDRWGSEPHLAARERLVLHLLDVAARSRVRVTILSGDVHMGALGIIKSSRMRAPANANVIYNLIASPIVHKPPPKIAVFALKVLDERFEIARDVMGEMERLPESRKRYLARRNYLLLDAKAGDWDATWWAAYKKHPTGERSFTKTVRRVD